MDLTSIEEQLQGKSIKESLDFFAALYPGQVAFSTSYGQEDQVLTDIIFKNNVAVNVFSIDTGRLFNETYELMQITEARYGKPVRVYFPETAAVESLVSANSINCFYQSTDLRKKCCEVRKVAPLRRALKDVKVWVTGLRAAQSENRNNMRAVVWDANYNLIKFNPLVDWDLEQVQQYLSEFKVPYNTLHDKGFVSIGCAPCTRAIAPGEDIRAGRWWWESDKKECGLHTVVDFQI